MSRMVALPALLNRTNVKTFIDSFDTVLFDCDGVLWGGKNGLEVVDGAADAVNLLRKIGKKIFYVSNNSTKKRQDYIDKCETLGFQASLDEIVNAPRILAQSLQQRNFRKKVYVIGSQGLVDELKEANIEYIGFGPDVYEGDIFEWASRENEMLDAEVGAVAVGFDRHFSYPKLVKSASYLKDPNCLFIGTNVDKRFPMPNSKIVLPGSGTMLEAVEAGSGRKAEMVGKPSKQLWQILQAKGQMTPEKTLIVGDTLYTDIYFGKRCGLHTLLVLSGISSLKDVENKLASADAEDHLMVPDFYLPKLGDILPLLKDF